MNHFDHVKLLLQFYKDNLSELDNDWPIEVQIAYTFIVENIFNYKLTISWMRQQHRLNKKDLATCFALYLDKKPKDFILYHRIEASKSLLKQTNDTITLIALSVGFETLAAFCNAFKLKVGKKPTTWRVEN